MTLAVSTIESKALQLADASTGDFSTANDVVPWVNEAQREIVKLTDCLVSSTPDTITTTAAENTYDLNADFWKEKRVEFDGDKCDFVEYDEIQTLIDNANAISPAVYSIWNDQIIIYTGDTILADKSIVIEYFRWAADVTGSSSTTDIPNQYADAIQFYVASWMAEANADYSLAERRMSQFYNRIATTRKEVRRRRSGPRKVKTEIYDKYSL